MDLDDELPERKGPPPVGLERRDVEARWPLKRGFAFNHLIVPALAQSILVFPGIVPRLPESFRIFRDHSGGRVLRRNAFPPKFWLIIPA
jgi:hypothetical protein